MLRHEADDGLRIIVHRRQYINYTEKSQQDDLIATEVTALFKYFINIQFFTHCYALEEAAQFAFRTITEFVIEIFQ
jgi:hypothetical protein